MSRPYVINLKHCRKSKTKCKIKCNNLYLQLSVKTNDRLREQGNKDTQLGKQC